MAWIDNFFSYTLTKQENYHNTFYEEENKMFNFLRKPKESKETKSMAEPVKIGEITLNNADEVIEKIKKKEDIFEDGQFLTMSMNGEIDRT